MICKEDKEMAVRSLARRCAGLILMAMSERSVDFDFIDIALDKADGTVREWVDDLTSGKADEPSLRNLCDVMTALEMRIDIRLTALAPSPEPNEAPNPESA